jgi:hypothetical protein
LAGKTLALALLAGLGSMCLGINIVLLPTYLPADDFWLWPTCYWGGGCLTFAGGIAIDVSVLLVVARFARAHLVVTRRS